MACKANEVIRPTMNTVSALHARSGRSMSTPCSRMVTVALMLAILASAGGCGSFGSKKPVEEAMEDENRPWTEVAVQFPALPRDADLLPFDVSAIATQRFAVDQKSLTVGADGVVRYTLVSVSESGARNITYEGIRCASQEQKIYALGHADGKWSEPRRSSWVPIVQNAVNRPQAALAEDYLCMGSSVAGDAGDMLARLRRRQTLTRDMTR